MGEQYHIPVLLKESVDGLSIKPGGVYVDLTYGGGGHSREILTQLGSGKLIVFDQDQDAFLNKMDDDRIIFVRHNFRYLKNFLRYLKIDKVQGILGDLGVSSHHFDSPERGFSFRFDGALDMRMSTGIKHDAAYLLNNYQEQDLSRLFFNYGEINKARSLAREINVYRKKKEFRTTSDLKEVAEKMAPKKEVSKFLAQVFQALRIEVNQEMAVLKETLAQTSDVLETGGRLVVISYHSLEDRLVKNFIKTGDCETSHVETDVFGHANVPFKAINRKIIIPGEEELELNNRARSGRLRIAERV